MHKCGYPGTEHMRVRMSRSWAGSIHLVVDAHTLIGPTGSPMRVPSYGVLRGCSQGCPGGCQDPCIRVFIKGSIFVTFWIPRYQDLRQLGCGQVRSYPALSRWGRHIRHVGCAGGAHTCSVPADKGPYLATQTQYAWCRMVLTDTVVQIRGIITENILTHPLPNRVQHTRYP